MSQLILIAEDEPKIASLLEDYLANSGFKTLVVHDGASVIPAVKDASPALVLLDLMLPNKDGFQICQEIRTFSKVPIIMLTARVEEIDRLLGLELGADDYVCKPFSPREVIARVKAMLRRMDWPQQGLNNDELQIHSNNMMVTAGNTRIDLTPVEFRLLETMAAQPGRVFSRAQLMNHAYQDHRVVSERTIDSHVKNLRRKIQSAAVDLDPITSVYGVGYRYEI